ncbi:MAG: NADH-quinone oxidoreductase subunit H [Candidatus Omnitrophica bacterium]|nr:NADH-quinone oxidoreductase subunit H [Candidatus Omnitrophota bacterium]
MIMILSILCHWLIVLLLAPFFIGVIAKVKAFFSGKVGPSVFQPFFDLIKLFNKGAVYSKTTTWIFRAAPMVLLASVLILSLEIPLGVFKAPVQFSGDIFFLAYLLALARFFMIAAALDTGFSMEGMGASREAFFSCLSELALFMNFITLALLAHSLSLSHMIGADIPMSWSHVGPALLLIVASFFIVLLTENYRIPIDDPDTHLELTMIHEVMVLDHSGVDLAYVSYASAIKFLIFSGILVPIIIPFRTGDLVMDMLIFLGGMLGLAVCVGIVESSMARLRLNRVRNFLLIAFALAFFGFIVTMWRG